MKHLYHPIYSLEIVEEGLKRTHEPEVEETLGLTAVVRRTPQD